MKTLFTALRAALYGSAFILLWGWIAFGMRSYDDRLAGPLPAWVAAPGWVSFFAGGLLAILCVVTFVRRGKGTPAPFDAPREFVSSGPYKYVRNPMYIGGLMMLAGFALFERSPSMLLFSLAWLVLAHFFVIMYEEPRLEQLFGGSYREYKQTVNRWLPKPQGRLTK